MLPLLKSKPPMKDTVSSPLHPFGLPMGSVRGLMAVLILGFFWLAVFWPTGGAKLPLGHFFLLPLVLYSFTLSTHDGRPEGFQLLPFLLRLLVTLGTVAVAGYAIMQGGEKYRDRLTPDVGDFQANWLPFAATLAGGFLAGHVIRLILGVRSPLFLSVRAWLSVVGLVMLAIEVGLLVMLLSSKAGDGSFHDFLRFYEFIEVGVVAAYFGTRV